MGYEGNGKGGRKKMRFGGARGYYMYSIYGCNTSCQSDNRQKIIISHTYVIQFEYLSARVQHVE